MLVACYSKHNVDIDQWVELYCSTQGKIHASLAKISPTSEFTNAYLECFNQLKDGVTKELYGQKVNIDLVTKIYPKVKCDVFSQAANAGEIDDKIATKINTYKP